MDLLSLQLASARFAPVACPSCTEPAAVVDRIKMQATDGALHHLKIRCSAGHWYTLPADRVQAYGVRLADLAA
jgi:hypothetical protein